MYSTDYISNGDNGCMTAMLPRRVRHDVHTSMLIDSMEGGEPFDVGKWIRNTVRHGVVLEREPEDSTYSRNSETC